MLTWLKCSQQFIFMSFLSSGTSYLCVLHIQGIFRHTHRVVTVVFVNHHLSQNCLSSVSVFWGNGHPHPLSLPLPKLPLVALLANKVDALWEQQVQVGRWQFRKCDLNLFQSFFLCLILLQPKMLCKMADLLLLLITQTSKPGKWRRMLKWWVWDFTYNWVMVYHTTFLDPNQNFQYF